MQKPLNTVPGYHFTEISDNDSFNTLCQQWCSLPFLVMDTEFVRTNTYYPKVGLLQFSDGHNLYLVDPLQIQDWSSFATLMSEPAVVKVLHSCTEDILVIVALAGVIPESVFDTQIGQAFLNQGFGKSYQALVADVIGKDIPKDETRSDWLQRPLTETQLEYAALDVLYLPQIYNSQLEKLQEQGKLAWCQEDCYQLLGQFENELNQDFSDYYLQLKGAWQLQDQHLEVLRLFAEWREQRARQRDKPRNWILPDKVLIEVARQLPTDKQSLATIEGISTNFLKYEADQLLELVRQGSSSQESKLEQIPRPLSNAEKKKVRKAQDYINDRAEQLDLPVEILARKKILMNLLYALKKASGNDASEPMYPPELQGWRKPLILAELVEILR